MNILYLAPIAFDYLKQRPQYLAEGLSQHHKVYYIEPTVSLLTALYRKELTSRGRLHRISENLLAVRLDGKFSLPYRLKYLDGNYAAAFYESMQLKKIIGRIDLIWAGYPGWADLVSRFPQARVVYDIMDDCCLLTRDPRTRAYIRKAEAWMERRAAQIITSSAVIHERLKREGRPAHLVPNAAEDSYAGNFEICRPGWKKRPFVYAGTIAEWFDNAAVRCIASAGHPVVLAGPASIPQLKDKNIRYAGTIPKNKVPELIKSSAACLYPFLDNELLDTINPVKIYEYLAFNRPVIARRSRETERFGDYVHLYSNMQQLQEILDREIEQPFQTREEYERFFKENTWGARIRQVKKALDI